MQHLVEEHSAVDPTYVEDFLLTYRTFLKTPQDVADRLLTWFSDPAIRDRVRALVQSCALIQSYLRDSSEISDKERPSVFLCNSLLYVQILL